MTKKILGCLAIVAVCALPAAAQAPFGAMNTVTGSNTATGLLGIVGHALDDSGIAYVDLYVDGKPVARAQYGYNSPWVAATYPGFPGSDRANFSWFIDTTLFSNGLHSVTAQVWSNAGERTILGPLTVEFMNATNLLPPFGAIEFPNEHAELRGVCDLADPNRRYTVVEGHVLDLGYERDVQGDPHLDPPGDAGVGYVELLIDGSIYANTRRDCFFSNATGGLTNCYGLRTIKVERFYPTVPDAPHAGFRFVLDIGALIELGYAQGQHILTIRAGDVIGTVANVDDLIVTFLCDENLPNEGSVGWLAAPPNGVIYDGTIEVVGWAIDFEGVQRVEIYANGDFMGVASYGFASPAIAAAYPGWPDAGAAKFRFLLDTTLLPDGDNDIQAIVVDVLGVRTLVGERRIFVSNHHP